MTSRRNIEQTYRTWSSPILLELKSANTRWRRSSVRHWRMCWSNDGCWMWATPTAPIDVRALPAKMTGPADHFTQLNKNLWELACQR